MKIALCTSDFFEPLQESIRESGHEVERVYTSVGLDTGFSDRTFDFAKEMKADFKVGKVTEGDLQELESRGVDLLLAAAYDYKVPTPEKSDIKFINIHGTLLPEGRGPWPQPRIILESPKAAGVTFHTMTQKWDLGDVVLQEPIDLNPEDNLDSLIGKVLLKVRTMSSKLLTNFNLLWDSRSPMAGEGSYWSKPNARDRTIDLTGATRDALHMHRAFTRFTLFVDGEGNSRMIGNLRGWEEDHLYKPGILVASNPTTLIYATKDGFLAITPSTL